MRLTVEQVRGLARAIVSLDPDAPTAVLAAWGNPTPEDVVASALELGDHPDRNVRVAALRVLAREDGDALAGVLRALDDPVKRVREVAAKSSARFVGDRRIVDRLMLAVEREEAGSLGPALQILGGLYGSPYGLSALSPIADAVKWLRDSPKYRQFALSSLLRSRTLSDEVAALLRDIVTNGSKEEAIAATRRLCGFRVAHHGELDDQTRQKSDRAWGDVYYWVRVADER